MIVEPASKVVRKPTVNILVTPGMSAILPALQSHFALNPGLLVPGSEPVILPSNDSEIEVFVLQVGGCHVMQYQAIVWRSVCRQQQPG